MIKNILKSKLFVLCSMLFCSLVVSVFCFGTFSSASGEFPSYDDFNDFTKSATNLNLDWNNDSFNAFKTYCEGNYNNITSIWLRLNSGSPMWCFQYSGNPASYNPDTNTVSIVKNNRIYFEYGSYNTATISSNTYLVYEQSDIAAFFSSYSDFVDALTPSIDWDNPFYSANIPNPNIYVSYRDLSVTPVIDVPLNVSVAPFPIGENVQEYYVQMFALVNMDFNYYVQNTRDGIVYNGLDMEKWTTYFDVVTPQEYKIASDLSEDYIHLALNDGWYSNYPQDSSFSFTFADGIPLNLQSSAITKFHNFRKNATFADNTVYLYVRYFVIDDNDNFVVGPWTVWKSYNPNEFYAELPSYYVPYNIVPGTQGTNTNVTPVSTSSPEPGIIVNPVNTNPSVNITVTQNVPNYPDYPTIASYNKDNLLVDTMNQLGSIQTFFGEFGSFLVTAFAFMPAWIWAIIGVGFSLSIVVMFLKIL